MVAHTSMLPYYLHLAFFYTRPVTTGGVVELQMGVSQLPKSFVCCPPTTSSMECPSSTSKELSLGWERPETSKRTWNIQGGLTSIIGARHIVLVLY